MEAAMARTQRSLQANAVFMAVHTPEGIRYHHYEKGKLQHRLMSPLLLMTAGISTMSKPDRRMN